MNILVTGGCGYVGSKLTKKLLDEGHDVLVVDTLWFGNNLEEHPRLEVQAADIRDLDDINLNDVEVIFHLANIANDPGVELNPSLSWEINVLATQRLAETAVRCDVRQFVYASSGSVYGVQKELDVTENLELLPISTYNKTKMVAERVLWSYKDQMIIHNLRPATICGCSPKMRLDLSVNMLTFQALESGKINVFGGTQTRPNIHIDDMVDVYAHFLLHPEIPAGNYNAGFENMAILDLAKKIAEKIPAEINITESNDPRSYRQNSDKLLSTGFSPKYSVSKAIDDIIAMFQEGKLKDLDQYHTVKWMKRLELDRL